MTARVSGSTAPETRNLFLFLSRVMKTASAAATAFCAIPITWILIGVVAALGGLCAYMASATKHTARLSDEMGKLRDRGDQLRATDQLRMERLGQLAEKESLSNAEMQEAEERLEALARFDAACDGVEGLLDDYAGELAENHSESYGSEKAIFIKLGSLLEERRELLSGDASNARWRRDERLKDRLHNLKSLGTIARRFWKIQDAFFN